MIGVNDYLDPLVDKLEYCVADARMIAKDLVDNCGYAAEHVLLMVDDQAETGLRPLRDNMNRQLPAWLMRAAQGDTVLVFYAGHGFLDKDGQGFLAPQDIKKNDLGLTGLHIVQS